MSLIETGERTCTREGCGQTFTPKNSRGIYCSALCRAEAFRSRSRNTEGAVPESQRARVATVMAIQPSGPLTWEPPAEPRRAYRTAEPCPACGEALHGTSRGTWRGCLACLGPVTPAAVKAPYERGETVTQRQVKSQAERDLEVLALEDRKGPMLDQLDALAGDDQLDTASVRKVGWFREQVESARSDTRLDELAALYPRAGIRRRRWWHDKPVAELDSVGSGYDSDGQDDDNSRASTGPSASAVDYVAELAARNWVLKPHGSGVCHVVSRGWDGFPDPCARRADCVIPGGAVCDHHHQALTTPLARRSA